MYNDTKRPKSKFTLEFKRDAIKLVTEKGYTHQQVADSLVIYLSESRTWPCKPVGHQDGNLGSGGSSGIAAATQRDRTVTHGARNIKKGRRLLCQGSRIKNTWIGRLSASFPTGGTVRQVP